MKKVKPEDLKGDIADFPIEVVQRMCELQVEQGDSFDPNALVRDGFDWRCTLEGAEFWRQVIIHRNFDLFFERYPKPKAHPHAELMMQYAQDAMETDKPWERWEIMDAGEIYWEACDYHPGWHSNIKYRRKPEKPKMCTLAGIEFPMPAQEPLEEDTPFFVPIVRFDDCCDEENDWWEESNPDCHWLLENGLIQLTPKGAIQQAKAMLAALKQAIDEAK